LQPGRRQALGFPISPRLRKNRNMKRNWRFLLLAALLTGCSKGPEAKGPGKAEPAPDVFRVKFETSKGDFVVQVTKAWAPLGADRFHELVQSNFFDGARFFRAVEGFMVQFGIGADPKVTALWESARIPDDPVRQSNLKGKITFATAGPGTRTTQLFINLVDNPRLDASGFSPFGEVVSGMDVVEHLYTGYGEGYPGGNGPRQDLIESQGNAYLEKEFPRLDYIKKASIQ
jgi:peptidyl-prolyl cis-trans isomerase A (cyclophilin A)